MLSSMSEAQIRAMAAARLGLPLVSHHVLQPSLAFCSQLPGEFIPGLSVSSGAIETVREGEHRNCQF